MTDEGPLQIRLKPADPFDPIRLLARSQNDPRKAVAELVQNSLDAGATHVEVMRYRDRKTRKLCLSIKDNGEGVLPQMDRLEALKFIATNIGHSIKRRLTAEERLRLMQLGQYGIGLLGFWSIGHYLTIQTRVRHSDIWSLRLEEDTPIAELEKDQLPTGATPTYTAVIIRSMHEAAQRLLTGRKLADYLGFELRGQLLKRKVSLRVTDKLARGRARRDYPVQASQFHGVPLKDLREWPVQGRSPMRVELYYLPEEYGAGQVALTVAGAVVVDSLPQLGAGDLSHHPWTTPRLTGIIDVPWLDVSPSTRRGLIPNEKVHDFLDAMRSLGQKVAEWLAQYETFSAAEDDKKLHQRLRQVFSVLARRLPHIEMFPMSRKSGPPIESDDPDDAERPTAGAAISPVSHAGPADIQPVPSKSSGEMHEDPGGRHTGVRTVERQNEDIDVPTPTEVKDPHGVWRSRMRGDRWEYNVSHPDYLLMATEPFKKFRYLSMLMAKELAIRQVNGGPNENNLLESLIQILATVEDRLARPLGRVKTK